METLEYKIQDSELKKVIGTIHIPVHAKKPEKGDAISFGEEVYNIQGYLFSENSITLVVVRSTSGKYNLH